MGVSDIDRISELRRALLAGLVIPAHPLALTEARRLDERRQVALTRYYCDAGAGGIAVGVHTTQFAIRDPDVQLLKPVLDLARLTVRDWCADRQPITIAGVCGLTTQAIREAELAASLGYDAALVSLAALRNHENQRVLEHCRRVADVIPVMGFYLQPAVGGRILDRAFWRAFLEIERVVAIKVAPFDRYRTLDVAAALAESGRRDVALYTGNDDAIIADLLTPFPGVNGCRLHFCGGLLGQWAVWTMRAVELLQRCLAVTRPFSPKRERHEGGRPASWSPGPESASSGAEGSAQGETRGEEILRLLALGAELTDANAALFDPAHQFAGCIPGIHEVLRRQGLLAARWCLDPHEDLSAGQMEEIDRVLIRYPHLSDDAFVREHLDRWLD
jgi:dihydrodipicolinate synthase/N-acetylneuraminate lyase